MSELRYALVTGASRGIGAAIAVRLAGSGFGVLINYRARKQAADAVKKTIEEAGGVAELCPFDVRDGEAASQAIRSQLDQGRKIAALVNNAGIIDDGPFPSMSFEAWSSVTRTTLDGFYNVTQPLVMHMVRQRWGRIINIASVSGVVGTRGQTNYSAAKAGLIGATRSLAQEVAKRGVTVNAVAPGLIDTEMIEAVELEHVMKMIPARRVGRADEVADLVDFLASDRSAYITGQIIGINGGLA